MHILLNKVINCNTARGLLSNLAGHLSAASYIASRGVINARQYVQTLSATNQKPPFAAGTVSKRALYQSLRLFAHLAALQTAIGHWSEMMFPLFSILRLEPAFKRPATQFMLLHLKRVHLMEWARAVMSVALGVKVHEDLPPMLMQQESDSVWTQIRKLTVTWRMSQ